MKNRKSFEERTVEKFEELKKFEDEKRMLHDTSIGGDKFKRPDKQGRDNITGEILTDDKLLEKAEAYVRRDMEQERIAEIRQEELEKRNMNQGKDGQERDSPDDRQH